MLNHPSVSITLEIYSHLHPEMLEQAVEGLENLLS
jgi:hypothetical protein